MAYLYVVLSNMVILTALATLLHVQFGLTGIVNFGLVGFWGLGLYAMGILMVNLGLPFVVSIILATLIVAGVSLVIGWIVLDLDDQAVLVATLAFATIVYYLVTTEKWLTKGVVGLGTIPFPFELGDWIDPVILAILVALTAPLVVYARRIRAQPYGRLLVAIRDNEGLARSLGKRTVRQKLVLFTVTSAAMGFFGAWSASLSHFLVPYMLGPTLTFSAWIALILGGKRHWAGGLAGVLAIGVIFDILVEQYAPIPTTQLAQMLPNVKYMLFGLLLILVIMFRPQGILGVYVPRHRSPGRSMASPAVAPALAGTAAVQAVPATRLHLRDVAKSFGGRRVVDIPELALGRHGIEGLIGPNGAGKTTLMNLVTQKLKLDAGRVQYAADGDSAVDITGMPIDRVARLGLVKTNQVIRDFDGLTIRDSLLVALAGARYERFYRLASEDRLRRETAVEIDRYLEYFRFENPDGYALSAGEKKLLDIIRCLLVRPRLLLMDEPTAGLPEDQTRRVMDLVRRKAVEEDVSIVIVEHDLGLIWEVCEYVHFMSDGEILVQGAPAEIRGNRIVAEKYLGVDRCLRGRRCWRPAASRAATEASRS